MICYVFLKEARLPVPGQINEVLFIDNKKGKNAVDIVLFEFWLKYWVIFEIFEFDYL